jgi:FKBP-type peptidyl-prolyl cis-trans isomerase FkpA
VRLIIFFLTGVIFSCNTNPNPFYSSGSGLKYKLISFGSLKQNKPIVYDYAEFEFGLLAPEDTESHLLNGTKVVQITGTNEPFFEALQLLSVGDSAIFIISSDQLVNHFNIPADVPEKLQLNVKLLNSYSPETFQKTFINLRKWINLPDDYEKQVLDSFLLNNKISSKSFYDGIWVIETTSGKGDFLRKGNALAIHYKGMFLDGKVFDDSNTREPFQFIFGTDGQVIKGLEKGLEKLKKGSKAKIIIPSPSAFGEKGSSTGIIPPNTTVVYEVEIIRVNN